MYRKLIYSILICLPGWFPLSSQAQNVHFSQFYSAPTIIGPSFAGMNRSSRLVMNYRRQWPGIDNTYNTYALSFDHYFERIKSGVGAMVMRDVSGAGKLGVTNFSLLYTRDFELTRSTHFRPGVEFIYAHNDINFREFTFGDQLSLTGPNAAVSIEDKANNNVDYIDVSASLLVYNNIFWAGATAKHLLEPDQSFLGNQEYEAKASMLFSGYGGVRFNLAERRARTEESVTVAVFYENKPTDNWDQLNIGLYYTYEPLMLGAWFRGLPVINEPQGYDINYIDAIIVMAGVKLDRFSIGYSYDFTVSELWNSNTGGAHEISIVYNFNQRFRLQRRRKYESIACPSF